MIPIPLESFGSITTPQQFTDTLQAAVLTRQCIQIPNGTFTLTQPIEYDTLRLVGCGGSNIQDVPKTEIRGDAALGDVPMFHRLDGWYLDSNDVRHGTATAGSTGTGTHVFLSDVRFRNLSPMGTIIELYNVGPMSRIERCGFGCTFRGITSMATFGMTIADCVFSQAANSAIVANDALLRRAWMARLTGHCAIVECNFQGGLTGIVATGPGCRILGGRMEMLHYGLILGAINLHQDQFGVQYPFAGEVAFTTTESIRRHVVCDWVQATSLIHGLTLTGTAAPQVAGGNGPCEYAIKIDDSKFSAAAKMERMVISGSYSQAAVIAPWHVTREQISINNTGSGKAWLSA